MTWLSQIPPIPKIMIGTALLGSVAGLVGCFAVLRRRALVGDMLAHAALPGVCLAFLFLAWLQRFLLENYGTDVDIGRSFLGLSIGALLSGLLGVGVVAMVCRWTRTKEDAAIGIVLSTFFGVGVVLLQIIARLPVGRKAGLNSYLFGQATSILGRDILIIAVVSLGAMLVLLLLYKEFKLLCFDADFARSQGWPVLVLDFVMMGTLAIVTVIGLPSVGVVLMAALIIIPGATARFWTERLSVMLLLSASFGAAAGLLGTTLSAGILENWIGVDPLRWATGSSHLPTGPVIVLSGTALFLFSVTFAPRRGILSRILTQRNLRSRISREHLLRSLYELAEDALPDRAPVPIQQIQKHRSWSPGELTRLLSQADRTALIIRANNTAKFTPAGLEQAARLTRNHRLWELFLIEGAGIAADHVDRDADTIEHMLTPEIIRELEEQLAQSGRLPPEEQTIPGSPHPVEDSESRPKPNDPT